MKTIAAIFLSVYFVSAATAQIDQIALQKKYESEIKVMRNILHALIEYDLEYATLPESLVTLVTKDYLKAVELHIKNEDGAVQIPKYYAARSSNELDAIVLTFDLPHEDQRIVVNLQGTFTIENKPKKAEQAGTEQPATRPESKSEGGDKPQPESEGRSR